MRNKGEIVASVDFGSREVRVIVARKDEDGTIQVVGHGIAPGRGSISQGVIQDLNVAQGALKQAIVMAELEARVRITSLFCGINGKNVETLIREGNVKLERETVEQSHMDEALDIASRDVMEAGKHVVSSISAQEWYVDDMRVVDPTGIRGHVLKTRVHFARIPSVIEENLVHCIESQRRELEDLVFAPIASSLGCLTPEDTELGVAVLDLGRTTTGLAVYRDRRILGTHSFDWGGYHMTRDVSAGLHISFEEADELILAYGVSEEYIETEEYDTAVGEIPRFRLNNKAQIKLKSAVHGARTVVPREELSMIIHERARELMTKVRQYLHSRGLVKHLIRGVVITGGGAQVKNYAKLAEVVFQVPCRVGVPTSVDILPPGARAADFSCAIGIVRHGFEFRALERHGHLRPQGPITQGIRKINGVIKKYFF